MPVEIKELVIRVNAQDTTGTGSSGPAASSAGGLSQEELIEACVKQVLQILRQSKSR